MIVSVAPANLMANHLWSHASLRAIAHDCGVRYVDLGLDAWADDFAHLRHDPTGGAGPEFVPAGAVRALRRSARHLDRRVVGRLRRAAADDRLPRWAAYTETGWDSTLERPDGVVSVDRAPFTDLVRSHRVVVAHGPLFRFADPAAFLRHRPMLADALRPTDAVVRRARAATTRARRMHATLVGVHVRRGDYAGYLGGRFHHDWSDYESLMRRIVASWGSEDVTFVVTSDESVPPGFGAGLTWNGGPGDPVGDLTALSQCDLIVGPPSTFSHWASFIGDVGLWFVEDPSVVPSREDFVRYPGLVEEHP